MSQAPKPHQGIPAFITPHADPRPMRPDRLPRRQPALSTPPETPLQRFNRLHADNPRFRPARTNQGLAARLAASVDADGNPRIGYAMRVRHLRAAIASLQAQTPRP